MNETESIHKVKGLCIWTVATRSLFLGSFTEPILIYFTTSILLHFRPPVPADLVPFPYPHIMKPIPAAVQQLVLIYHSATHLRHVSPPCISTVLQGNVARADTGVWRASKKTTYIGRYEGHIPSASFLFSQDARTVVSRSVPRTTSGCHRSGPIHDQDENLIQRTSIPLVSSYSRARSNTRPVCYRAPGSCTSAQVSAYRKTTSHKSHTFLKA